NRAIVVADATLTARIRHDLKLLAATDPRLLVLDYPGSLDRLGRWNKGLSAREWDAAMVAASAMVCDGWLSELAAVAHSEERVAGAAPFGDLGEHASHKAIAPDATAGTTDEADLRTDYSGLPRGASCPTFEGSCVYYLRTEMIDAVGLLDASFSSIESPLDDWVIPARFLGLVGKPALH